jgi:hypothetical protein
MLSAASERTLCTRTHRSFDSALRLKAIQLEKRARQKGFTGHENRCLRDPIYTVNMNALGYPPEFCESILPEVIDYLVWVANRPPEKPLHRVEREQCTLARRRRHLTGRALRLARLRHQGERQEARRLAKRALLARRTLLEKLRRRNSMGLEGQ